MRSLKLQFKIKSWFVPLLVSIGLFWFIRPAIAQFVERQEGLSTYLSENNVPVGIEVVDGFSRVFYSYEGNKTYISEEGQNGKQVFGRGRYVVWVMEVNDGPGQVYLYDILNDSTVQITHSGNNANPKVGENGNVVWEGWISSTNSGQGGMWQVFFFNGIKVLKITEGDLSVNPDIEGDYISYARRDITGTWRSVVYSISRNEAREVATGISSKHPKVRNGKVFLSGGIEEFPLTAEDLFILDLMPLTATDLGSMEELEPVESPTPVPIQEESQFVSEDEIIKELNATSSAVAEEPTTTSSGETENQ